MEFSEWLIGGGMLALFGSAITYLNYINKLKKQTEKEASEKARINENLKHLSRQLDSVSDKFSRLNNRMDIGVSDYYNLKRDLAVIEQSLRSLIRRYNREHPGTDIRTPQEVRKDDSRE